MLREEETSVYLGLIPIFNQLVGGTAKLTLVQLDHFGGWIFGRRGNPVVWRWVMRRGREKKKSSTSRAVRKLVVKLVGEILAGCGYTRDFGLPYFDA